MSASPLPPDLEQFVFNQVAIGNYQSAAEVLCDGVRLLRDREARLAQLRAEIDRGLKDVETGNFIELDSQEALKTFFADIQARGKMRRSTAQADS